MHSSRPSLKWVVSAVLAAIILTMVGCGGPERLPPQQVIERAVPVVQNANSFHFTLDTLNPPKTMKGLYLTRADGDVARPDKLAGDVDLLFNGLPLKVKVVVDGESQYMTDPASGKWGEALPGFNVARSFNPSQGVADILSNVKGLEDDGAEKIGGADTYRLKGTVAASALKALSPEITAEGELDATLWIDASNFELRKAHLKGPVLSGEPAEVERVITLSWYNKEVRIETPAIK